MKSLRLFVAAAAAAIALGSASAEPAVYNVGENPARVNLTFSSVTDFEDIVGSTNDVKGTVVVDEADISKSAVSLTVPVASLKTGIAMRDEHLQGEKWLNAAKNPNITFRSTKVEPGSTAEQVTVTGDFTMNGVTKPLTLTVTGKKIPAATAEKAGIGKGDWARFQGQFTVKFSDHGIVLNEGAAMKVADTITINFSLFARAAE
ncbi:MAG: YceI family protein [Candidatus Sumerlaeia bacterium]|nr:YceI family protein [Candidatus Sumerlaeia bacterium]